MVDVYGVPLPENFGDVDVWGLKNNASHVAGYNAYLVRTENADWQDKFLSRPKLRDYSEVLTPKGTVSSGTVTCNLANEGNHISMTVAGNIAIDVTNPPPTNTTGFLFLYITQDATGGRVVTFPATFKDEAGAQFALTNTDPSKRTRVVAQTLNSGASWMVQEAGVWTP